MNSLTTLGRNKNAMAITLLAIIGVATAFRFAHLNEQSLWVDEAGSWHQSQGSLKELLHAVAKDNYPPLHNLLLYIWMKVFGESEAALRAPSAILGILNVSAVYWVGSLLGSRRAGVIAALFLAMSGFHIWYSQEARMYTLLALSATLFVGTGVKLISKPSLSAAVTNAICGLALLYSHPYGLLTWLPVSAALAYAICRNRGMLRLPHWLLLQAAILVGFAPWILIFSNRAKTTSEEGFYLPNPTPDFLFQELLKLTTGPWSLFLISICTAGLLFATNPRTSNSNVPNQSILLLSVWAVAPIVLGVVVSMALFPIVRARYWIGSLPAIILLASLGLTAALHTGRHYLIAILVVITVLGASLNNYSPASRRDWRSTAAFLNANLRPTDCVFSAVWGGHNPLEYYRRQGFPCLASIGLLRTVDSRKWASAHRVFIISKAGAAEHNAFQDVPPGPWQKRGQKRFSHGGLEVLELLSQRAGECVGNCSTRGLDRPSADSD